MANVYIDLPPGAATFPTTDFGAPWWVANVPSLAFDAATDEAAYFDFPAINYASGNVTVAIEWYSLAGSTTGSVTWEASIMAQTPGDAESVEAVGYAAVAFATTTVNSTAKGPNRTTITVTGLDSLAANDRVRLKIARDANGTNGTDNMAGDSGLTAVTVSYLST